MTDGGARDRRAELVPDRPRALACRDRRPPRLTDILSALLSRYLAT
jgi:hypothetical protein